MSTKLNKRQRIAAELIGLGHRPSAVASQLNVSRETISRWRLLPAFRELTQKAHLDLLASLLADRLQLLNRCHEILGDTLDCKDTSVAIKGSLAVRYLALNGSASHVYQGLKNDQRQCLSSDKENNQSLHWIFEIIRQLSYLKTADSHLSDAEYRKKAEAIVQLPKN